MTGKATKLDTGGEAASLPLGTFTTKDEAIRAILSLDDRFASLTVSVQKGEAAMRAGDAERLSPNPALAEALREGLTLNGRYASPEELFDALEEGW